MNVSQTYTAHFPGETGRAADLQFTVNGSGWSSAGVAESATVPGKYAVTVTHPAAYSGSIDWRLPTGDEDDPYDYASEDIRPDPLARLVTTTAVVGLDANASGFTGETGLSSQDNFYLGQTVKVASGASVGATSTVASYTGSLRRFTLFPALPAGVSLPPGTLMDIV